MGDETYTVNYFGARGLAEPIRFILAYAGAKWEDNRIPFETFPPVIPEELKARLPYGQVPLLDFNGQSLSQSNAIQRYLARKFNLVGDSELEAAKCDEIVDAASDLRKSWIPYWIKFSKEPVENEINQDEKAEALKKITADSKTQFLSKFNTILEENGGHFVGKGLTWADFNAVHAIDNLQIVYDVSLVDDFPALQKLIDTVFGAPGIKEYVESRPITKY